MRSAEQPRSDRGAARARSPAARRASDPPPTDQIERERIELAPSLRSLRTKPSSYSPFQPRVADRGREGGEWGGGAVGGPLGIQFRRNVSRPKAASWWPLAPLARRCERAAALSRAPSRRRPLDQLGLRGRGDGEAERELASVRACATSCRSKRRAARASRAARAAGSRSIRAKALRAVRCAARRRAPQVAARVRRAATSGRARVLASRATRAPSSAAPAGYEHGRRPRSMAT
jgi:hypothetical protein